MEPITARNRLRRHAGSDGRNHVSRSDTPGAGEEMQRDPAVLLIGEDIGVYGGAFKATAGLLDRFGWERVIDTPISERR